MVSQLNPYIGATLTAKSFVIAIIGGLDNPFGVIVGGLFLGIAESLAALYIGPTYADVMSFGLLVAGAGRAAERLAREDRMSAAPHRRCSGRSRRARRRAVVRLGRAGPVRHQRAAARHAGARLEHHRRLHRLCLVRQFGVLRARQLRHRDRHGAVATALRRRPGVRRGARRRFRLLLGLPVLRLKGHYFAIATLGIGAR